MHFFSKNQHIYIESRLSGSDGMTLAENQELTANVKAAVEARMIKGQKFRYAVNSVLRDFGIKTAPAASFFHSSTFRVLSFGLVALLALLLYFFASAPQQVHPSKEKSAFQNTDVASSTSTIQIRFQGGTTYHSLPASKKAFRKIHGTP
ncbi:MAG: hypothetical protein AAF990_26080 [Bacteroidota bacterium]